jgi:hypothetical protein
MVVKLTRSQIREIALEEYRKGWEAEGYADLRCPAQQMWYLEALESFKSTVCRRVRN